MSPPISKSLSQFINSQFIDSLNLKSLLKSEKCLLQGLHGKDSRILNSVLDRADEELIDNTVRRLPTESVVPLVTTLQKYIKVRAGFSKVFCFRLY